MKQKTYIVYRDMNATTCFGKAQNKHIHVHTIYIHMAI